MKIVQTQISGSHKTGSIVGLTKAQISAKLGFDPEFYGESGDGKVEYEWQFTASSKECAIWDWKGGGRYNEHSAFGDPVALRTIFGSAYSSGNW